MLMGLLASWVTLSFGLWVTAALVPGFRIQGFGSALVVGAIFGVLHALLKYVLFITIGFATLGLGFLFWFVTWWIVAALILKLTDAVTDRLYIDRFRTALIAAAVLAVLSAIRDRILG